MPRGLRPYAPQRRGGRTGLRVALLGQDPQGREARRPLGLDAAEVADARQAIEDGAVVPSTREGVFHVVSSDGTEVHRTAEHGCNCTNGLQTRPPRPCWHRCAVAIMTASQAPAAGLPTAPVALPCGTAPVAADVLSVLTDKLSAGGDVLPVLTDVWTALEAMGALAGAAAPF